MSSVAFSKRLFSELPKDLTTSAKALGQTVLGVGFSALSVLTLGKNQWINNYASWTGSSYEILLKPYMGIAKVLDPDKEPKKTANSFLTAKIASPIFKKAMKVANDPSSFFQRHIVSRGAYFLLVLVTTITRVVDLALAAIALPLSLITLSKVRALHEFAFDQLSSLLLINDFCVGVRACVNPHQFSWAKL